MTMTTKTHRKIDESLVELDRDLHDYRTRMKWIFVRKFTRPGDYRMYFFNILVSASKLYADWLMMKKLESELWDASHKSDETFKRESHVNVEVGMRERFRERIDSARCWSFFNPLNECMTENQLRTPVDYINSVTLHLPEIYGEAFALEGCSKAFRKKKLSSRAVADLLVGVEHIAHHVSYCRYALEILAHEMSWRDAKQTWADGKIISGVNPVKRRETRGGRKRTRESIRRVR